jgi:hypothetical protein
MANYVAQWRSNYFHVKDEEEFGQAMSDLNIHVGSDDKGRCGIFPSQFNDGNGIPWVRYNEETDEDEDTKLDQIIAKHLIEGEVAILMETGHENLRYVIGEAIAVNAGGETVTVSLNDIYRQAEEELAPGANITMAQY